MRRVFALALFALGCAHTAASPDCLPGARLVHSGGVESCILGKDTEHGLVRVRDTKTGALVLEERWENGRREGASRAWHPGGWPSFEGAYRNGGPEGRWLEWYDDGSSESDFEWRESRRTGVWTLYYRGGRPAWRRTFDEEGALAGETLFDEDGRQTRGEGLPKAVLGLVMKHNKDRLRFCYEKQLARDAKLAGKISLRFEIDGAGKVGKAEIAESTFANAELASCILGGLRALEFPRPIGGSPVAVTYPYAFKP